MVAEIQVRIFATDFFCRTISQYINLSMKEMMRDINYFGMREMLKDCICEVQEKAVNSSLPGISTGFKPIDDLTGGLENGKVYVIGGRPCMGKEEFMLSMIIDIVLESRLPVLMFSTNHLKTDYVQRLLAILCDIPITHLSQRFLEIHEWERLDKNVGALLDAPLFIHDSLDLPSNELTETARNCIREKGTKIIFIDCLQMIDFANEDETSSERIAKVMCSLKQLACFFDIPIVIGSMLNRGVENREGIEGKQPQLMDLANSSYIEGLADVIMMVHRPEYYRIYQDDHGRDLHGLMEIFVEKNNLKPLGNILLYYHQDTGVVSVRKNTIKSSSKLVSMKELGTDNKAVKSLIDSFGLEEELPF